MPTPSLILVPARFKTGKLYTPLATTSGGTVLGASGDFNVTRATSATRVNASGLIESVASGVPRLDYYTSGGVAGCPALLVEPSAANGILNSTDTTTNWTLGANLTSGAIDVIGVTGNNITVAVSGSGITSADGRLGRLSNNVALASGSTYTVSFFLKKTGTHTIGGYVATITGGAAGNIGAGFNISGSFSSGSTLNTAGTTGRIRRVEQWGTDVYRCSETFTMTASGTLTNFFLAPLSGVTSTNNPAVDLGIGFAAPQIELGSVPTSFIPTTTGSITRNADVISVSGAVSGCIGQTEGTIYAEVDYRAFASTSARRIISLRLDGSNVISLETSAASGSILLNVVSGTSNISATATGLTNGIYKIAAAYNNDASGTVIYVNGTLRDTKTSVVPDVRGATIGLGIRSDLSAGTQFNDRIRSAALYTTRLTNAQLASLTT